VTGRPRARGSECSLLIPSLTVRPVDLRVVALGTAAYRSPTPEGIGGTAEQGGQGRTWRTVHEQAAVHTSIAARSDRLNSSQQSAMTGGARSTNCPRSSPDGERLDAQRTISEPVARNRESCVRRSGGIHHLERRDRGGDGYRLSPPRSRLGYRQPVRRCRPMQTVQRGLRGPSDCGGVARLRPGALREPMSASRPFGKWGTGVGVLGGGT
jgi:hypothetical protein